MKIRTDFVSNSSSSSFVLVGFKPDNNKVEELTKEFGEERVERNGFNEVIQQEGFACPSIGKDTMIGKSIARWGDGENMEDGSLSIAEIQEIAMNVSEKFKVNIEDVKLYFGAEGY